MISFKYQSQEGEEGLMIGKATMVSNLLVVLCSEQTTQPVVNTGSLYR